MAGDRRAWLGLAAVVAVLVVATGWLTLIGPVRADTEAYATQESDVRDRNAALARSIAVLREQQASLPSLRSALQKQLHGLPTDGGLPELTRQLTGQAATAGVGMTAVVVGTITPVADGGDGTGGASPAAAAGAAAPTTAGQLYAIPVTVTTTGPASRQIAFLRAVQQAGPRRALVVSTQLTPGLAGAASGATSTPGHAGSIDAGCTMTTVLTVFSAPVGADRQAQLERLIAGPYAI